MHTAIQFVDRLAKLNTIRHVEVSVLLDMHPQTHTHLLYSSLVTGTLYFPLCSPLSWRKQKYTLRSICLVKESHYKNL